MPLPRGFLEPQVRVQLVLFGMPNGTFQTLLGMHSSTCRFLPALWNHRLGCALEARQACTIGHFTSYLSGHCVHGRGNEAATEGSNVMPSVRSSIICIHCSWWPEAAHQSGQPEVSSRASSGHALSVSPCLPPAARLPSYRPPQPCQI
jgi:hypothetical protein